MYIRNFYTKVLLVILRDGWMLTFFFFYILSFFKKEHYLYDFKTAA